VADAGNELFLVVAVRRSARPPDASHPFGYGPERYYWALLAAIGMFLIGGAVSIWEGIQALLHPTELEAFWVGVAVLVVALVLDGISRTVAVRALRAQAQRRGISVRTLLRESPDPAITTVYLEDTVDVLGAALALAALVLHRVTGSAFPDALATLLIGCLLAYVAVRLARRNRALLTNSRCPSATCGGCTNGSPAIPTLLASRGSTRSTSVRGRSSSRPRCRCARGSAAPTSPVRSTASAATCCATCRPSPGSTSRRSPKPARADRSTRSSRGLEVRVSAGT
jgi:hypothetical protein